MGVQVQWDNEARTILRYDYQGRWKWEQVYEAVNEAYRMIETVPHPVAVMIDMTESAGIPPGALTHGRSLLMV